MEKMNYRFVICILITISILGVFWVNLPANVNAQHLHFSDKEKLAKRLIVNIEGADGAGIIVGSRGYFLIIITAGHVVEGPSKYEVEFEFSRRNPIPAEVKKRSQRLDLAVIQVDLRDEGLQDFSFDLIPFEQTGYSNELKRWDDVHIIGHPHQHYWDSLMAPAKVKKIIGETIHIEHACLPGHSGGGVFNDRWELVGMVLSDERRFPAKPLALKEFVWLWKMNGDLK